MDDFISPNRLAEFRQTLAKLGYDIAEESLYESVIAIVRFVAEIKSKQLKTNIANMKTLNEELQHRLKNRYEIIGSTLNQLKQQDEFIFKSQGTKRSMVHAIGYNPKIIDRRINITPYTWLKPIQDFLEKNKISPQSGYN